MRPYQGPLEIAAVSHRREAIMWTLWHVAGAARATLDSSRLF